MGAKPKLALEKQPPQDKPDSRTETRVFQFSVDDDGKFSYDPPGTWQYLTGETVQFRTKSGPFTVSLRRSDTLLNPNGDAYLKVPFGGDLQGKEDPAGTWTAEAKVNDGLSDAVRRTEIAAKGFVAHYHYLIRVQRGSRVFQDLHKSGTHMC